MARHTPPQPNDQMGRLQAQIADLRRRLESFEAGTNAGGGFIALPFNETAWKNYGGGWGPAGYTRDSTGFVRLRGLITPVTEGVPGGAFSGIATLPEGFRPGIYNVLNTTTINGQAVFRVDVYTNGLINVMQSTLGNFKPGDYVSLWNIGFYAGA